MTIFVEVETVLYGYVSALEKVFSMLNNSIYSTSLYKLNWSWQDLPPGALAALILTLLFGIFTALELHAPRQKIAKKWLRQSYSTNLSLFVLNSLIMSVLSASSLWIVAKHNLAQGLLSVISNPIWKVVLSLLSLDLLLYVWHKACHRFDGLWMFHKVHHNDPYLNVSTGFRIHIAELFMTYILKATIIILLGIDELIVLVNEVVTTAFIMFHHTNSSFKGEKWVGYVLTTPSLHRTHHSVERNEHDSNYGAILSIWDRIFGTISKLEPARIGIKGDSPLDFVNLVKFGFTGQQQTQNPMPANLEAMIAEAAYYKAEKRNFAPGQEMADWLEAKQEIVYMVYSKNKAPADQAITLQRNLFNWLNQLYCSMVICEKRIPNYE